MNSDVIKLMKERDFALKTAIKSKSISARKLFTSLRNKVVNDIQKAKADFFLTIIANSKGDSKTIWNQLKKLVYLFYFIYLRKGGTIVALG